MLETENNDKGRQREQKKRAEQDMTLEVNN